MHVSQKKAMLVFLTDSGEKKAFLNHLELMEQ